MNIDQIIALIGKLEKRYSDSSRSTPTPLTIEEETLKDIIAAFYSLIKTHNPPLGFWQWFEEQYTTAENTLYHNWGWRCSHCGFPFRTKPEYDPELDSPPTAPYCSQCGAKLCNRRSS